MEIIEDYFERNQISTGGPILPASWQTTGKDYWKLGIILLLSFLLGFFTTWQIFTALYHFNPGYGRNLEMEQAFCVEIDEMFVNSQWKWSDKDLMCIETEKEANREN